MLAPLIFVTPLPRARTHHHSQTTIEFYRNRTREKRMKLNGRLSQNEYDLGRRRNWEAVFGKSTNW